MTSQCWQAVASPCAELHLLQQAETYSLTKTFGKRLNSKACRSWRVNLSVRSLCTRSQAAGQQLGLQADVGTEDLTTWQGAQRWTDGALREQVDALGMRLGNIIQSIDSFASGKPREGSAGASGEGLSKGALSEVSLNTVVEGAKGKAVAWWKEAEPWNKWPLAIFAPWCLLAFLVGGQCGKDLLPFWVLGPILLHLIIKSSMVLAEQTEPLRRVAVTKGEALYLHAKSGQLKREAEEALAYLKSERFISDAKSTAGEKQRLLLAAAKEKKEALRAEFHEWASEKKDEIVEYRKSGQMQNGAQVLVKSAVGAAGEWFLARIDQVEGLIEPYLMKAKEFIS